MKFFKRLFFAVLLLVALDFGYDHAHEAAQALRNYHHRFDAVTLAQRASHRIIFDTDTEVQKSVCSGTAVGPHTFLTASHCNEDPDNHYTMVQFDWSVTKFHVQAELTDKHDHVLYLLDGPAFTQFVNMQNVVPKFVPERIREKDEVVVYGSTPYIYPPVATYGYVDIDAEANDLSDVDVSEGTHYYVISIRHGNSGSAVYDLKTGKILGLLSLGFGWSTDASQQAASFALQFPKNYEAQLEKLAAEPKPKPAPVKKIKKETLPDDF
jgi:hypothetical protein